MTRRRGKGAFWSLTFWSGLNAAAVVLLWVLDTRVAEATWFTTLLAYSPQWPYGVPLLVLLGLSAWRRAGRAALVNAAATVVFVLGPLGFCVPLGRAPRTGPTVRVMTWNIHGGREGVQDILAAVREADPDVLCLQEAALARGRRALPGGFAANLPGYQVHTQGNLVIASRLPIVAVSRRPLSPHAWYRPLLEARVLVGDRVLTVQTVHYVSAAPGRSLFRRGTGIPAYLRQTGRVRREQTDALLALDRTATDPLVLCGDFNTPPRGLVYGALRSRFRDAFSDAGLGTGYTYPAARAMLRIDYVFAAGGVRAVDARAPAVAGSDHRPVVADLVVP